MLIKGLHFPLTTVRTLVLITLIVANMRTQSQTYPMDQGWMAGISGGLVSFFGDLSIYDNNAIKKITQESDEGYSFMVGKQLDHVISLKVSYLRGKVKGSNPGLQYAFQSNFSELNLTTELNLTELILPTTQKRLEGHIQIGVGVLSNTANKSVDVNDSPILTSKISEAVLITGVGLNYNLSKHWKSILSYDMRTTWNDELDAHQGTSTSANDYYSFFSAGLVYIITPAGKTLAQGYPCSPW